MTQTKNSASAARARALGSETVLIEGRYVLAEKNGHVVQGPASFEQHFTSMGYRIVERGVVADLGSEPTGIDMMDRGAAV